MEWHGNSLFLFTSTNKERVCIGCAHTQCKTSKMHGTTRAYLCYSCHFVTPPCPLQPDLQKHSSSLNTLHLLIQRLHHTASCIFGVPVPPERQLPRLFCRIDLWPHAPISAPSLLGSGSVQLWTQHPSGSARLLKRRRASPLFLWGQPCVRAKLGST